MLFNPILDCFAQQAPISVMVRSALEYAHDPATIDALFHDTAEQQHEKTLLFSSVVDLMTLVVARVQPSRNATYQAASATLPISLTSVYTKINGTETAVSAALVAHSAIRLQNVIDAMASGLEPWLTGYRFRVMDGNHLPSTERRLDVLRQCPAGPLPGRALVVLEPDAMLATYMLPCEDAHAQERSTTQDILALAEFRDCRIADRNFCTFALLNGIATRQAFFVIRHHAKLRIVSSGRRDTVGEARRAKCSSRRLRLKEKMAPFCRHGALYYAWIHQREMARRR